MHRHVLNHSSLSKALLLLSLMFYISASGLDSGHKHLLSNYQPTATLHSNS